MRLSDDSYKILESETVYKSSKLQVDRAKIAHPNSKTVEWDTNIMPSCYYGIPVRERQVIMTREWRYGPNKVLTQFTASRNVSDNEQVNLSELKRELREELGLVGGRFEKLISFQWGFRTSGEVTYYVVNEFTFAEPARDEDEIQEIITLPIQGLYKELVDNHVVTSDTLLIAKLLEERL